MIDMRKIIEIEDHYDFNKTQLNIQMTFVVQRQELGEFLIRSTLKLLGK